MRGNCVKTVQISEELYDKLKAFVVDPFDDTPETVLMRVVEIAAKAKHKWLPFGNHEEKKEAKEFFRSEEEGQVVAL